MADSAEPETVHVGLTGGIGAGKSTVARLLAERGAVVLDADVAAREVVAAGTDGLAAVAAEFGDAVLAADGTLDRPALARIVFGDEDRRTALNAIVHPRVRAWMEDRASRAEPGSVVVQDIPLLVESNLAGRFDLVVVVDAPDRVRIDRLVRDRGMAPDEAQARIDAQLPRDRRLAAADVVVANDGPVEDLTRQIDELWQRLTGMR